MTERLFQFLFWIALVLVTFVAGALAVASGIFPGPQIERAYSGGQALYYKLTAYDDVYVSDLWTAQRTADRGVTVLDRSRMQDGLTLFTSGVGAVATLMEPDGTVVHEWRKPYSEVWTSDSAVHRPQPDSHVYFRKAMLVDESNLIAIYEGVGDTPYGYGMVKLDAQSNVIWRFLENTHHDFDIAADGSIVVLTHRNVTRPLPGFEHLKDTRLDDFLVFLDANGRKLKEIDLIEVVKKSQFRQLLYTVSSFALADPLHTNSVHVITEDEAHRFPFGKAGQLLMSFRELGAIAVVDPQTETLVWAARGPWLGQHDPLIIDNGHILMFDNFGYFDRPEARSRALEIDPRTLAIVWQYAGTAHKPLDSAIRAYARRLANGNTLITESSGGRLLEVTRGGDIVWEYIAPQRHNHPAGLRLPILCKAQRIERARVASLLGQQPHPQPTRAEEDGNEHERNRT